MTGARVLLTIQLAFAAAFHAAPTSAAVIERDLVPGSGDGLLTFDDVNNREWLDVPETLLSQFAPGQSLNVALNIALMELEPGGRFEEFTWATQADVFALAESAGIDTTTDSFDVNSRSANALADLLGRTNIRNSIGFIDELNIHGNFDSIAVTTSFELMVGNGPFAGFFIGSFETSFQNIDSPQSLVGLMLYRSTVPEPSAVILACGFSGYLVLVRFMR